MTIRILPPQLANQIAAGEVVERPASIIKELVENSIDSGANRIDIDIEQGGCKLIRIRDNGCGIAKDDLPLALARHATSKISSLDDLEAIVSLGFRGEALASISSVSRLTLTSKPDEQAEAWQVYAEGRDMAAVIKPASHPTGTTVEVLDIFYNTPARRRFLKTEKTEFTHIDEVVRRIALACPHIAFNLQHNGKLLRQYRAADSEAQVEKRLVAVCGMAFMQKAIKLCWEHDYLSIKGWVATNIGQEPIQYFYVNGRVVKDRLLNHALKQAFHELSASSVYSTDETLSYVIYLELDPHHVDVNVHPAKHEVRFHEARLVHDFVHQAMFMALEEQKKPSLALDKNSQQNDNQPIQPQPVNQNRTAAGQNIFNAPAAPTSTPSNNTNTHQHSDYGVKKASHIKENRLYGQLVESQIENHHVKEDYISPEQQAVIESLFPKRTQLFQAVHKEVDLSSAMNLGKVLTIIDNQYVLLEKYQYNHQQISLLSLKKAQQAFFMATMATDDELLSTEHLLIPLSMLLSKAEQQLIEQTQSVLTQLGFQFCIERSKLQLNAVPKLMRKANWQQLFPKLIAFMQSHCSSSELKSLLTNWLAEQYMQIDHNQEIAWNVTLVIQFLTKFEQLQEVPCNMNDIVKPVELSSIISLFK